MTLNLLAGYEHLDHRRSYGGTHEADVPWRFVFHTTEAVPSTIARARQLALDHPYPPHLWVWPEKNWKAQTVLLSRSSFALLHPRGTPHTNRMRAIQVEVFGYAKDSPRKPAWWWEWLGTEVLAPVIDAGYPINLANLADLTGPDGYGPRGSVRMTRAAWRHFDGVCAHSNVPDNAHWDIGDGRLDLIAAAATPDQEDHMARSTDLELIEAFADWLGRPPADDELANHRAYAAFHGVSAAVLNIARSEEAKRHRAA